MTKRYDQRGVSATKDDVHKAIANVDKGLFHSRTWLISVLLDSIQHPGDKSLFRATRVFAVVRG